MFTIIRPTLKKVSPMGMIKSGTWTGPSSSNVWTDVPAMIADPAYPMSIFSANKLTSDGNSLVNIQASISWTGALATKQIGVIVNGVRVWEISGGSISAGIVAGNFNWQLRPNDIIGLQANTSNSARGDVGAANTFLRWSVL